MTLSLTSVFILEKSIKSLFLLAIIFLVRPILNKKAFRSASIILWMVLLIYLISPYELEIGIESVKGNSILIAITNFFNSSLGWLVNKIGSIFFKLNRLIGSVLIFTYLGMKIYRFNKVMKGSTLTYNTLCKEKIREFGLKRKVEIYINNNLKTPLTFGILKPKIILQDHILADEKLLNHVLIHELMHIKKFHILLNHLVNIVACLYWFNPLLWLSLKYLDQDIEINCDKLVVENLGDTRKNRKAYCSSMLKLVEREFYENNLYLKLNPNIERMNIIKNWKKTLLGLISFILAFTLSLPAFANVTDLSQDRVDTQGEVVNNIEVNIDNRVQKISDQDYKKLELGKLSVRESDPAKVNEKIKLGSFEKTSYEFELNNDKNEGFIINLKDMSCSGGIKYQVFIEEDGEIIYDKRFASDSILKVKAQKGSAYIITVSNEYNKKLLGEVSINTYASK
ncbi:M56 family metallopeptidase [uncultured Anaerococcus sp.]|uniref:M56 family metallopeptidase n=1 Tax=uncultured Anaerococcus sp. TaxID=293428 RepID=UPI00288BD2FC|nr:M56 family metallopeptidase [uncultured Anaerococcus sp.]